MMLDSFGGFLYISWEALFMILWGVLVFYLLLNAFKIAVGKKPLIFNLSHFRIFAYGLTGLITAAEVALIVNYLHSNNWNADAFYYSDMAILLSVMIGTWLLLVGLVKNAYELESVAVFSFGVFIVLWMINLALVFIVKNKFILDMIELLISTVAIPVLFLPVFCYGKYIVAGAELSSVKNAIRHSVRHNMGVGEHSVHLRHYFGKSYLRIAEDKNWREGAIIASMYQYWDYIAEKYNAPSIGRLLRVMFVPAAILTFWAWLPIFYDF